MKSNLMTIILGAFSVLALVACGGGGGGGGGPVTKANTKVFLFGNITSATNIVATTKTTLNIPSGVLVNYSSAPGAVSGLTKLRDGVIVPSGTIKVNAADFSGSTYDIASRVLTINMYNSGRVALKSSATGKGSEFATVILSLTTAGVTPTAMPVADSLAQIGQENTTTHDITTPAGNSVNFDTTYQ